MAIIKWIYKCFSNKTSLIKKLFRWYKFVLTYQYRVFIPLIRILQTHREQSNKTLGYVDPHTTTTSKWWQFSLLLAGVASTFVCHYVCRTCDWWLSEWLYAFSSSARVSRATVLGPSLAMKEPSRGSRGQWSRWQPCGGHRQVRGQRCVHPHLTQSSRNKKISFDLKVSILFFFFFFLNTHRWVFFLDVTWIVVTFVWANEQGKSSKQSLVTWNNHSDNIG